MLLPQDVLLDDPPHGSSGPVRDAHGGFHDLGGANQLHHLLAADVVDREAVCEELVDLREEPQRLLGLRLSLFSDHADLIALLVQDPVLVRELDELRLLIDDKRVPRQQIRHGSLLTTPAYAPGCDARYRRDRRSSARVAPEEITLFRSLGLAIEDL